MISSDPDKGLREKLIDYARAAGGDAADAIAIRSRNVDVSVRKGAIEDASGAESFGIGLRVFKGLRQAYGSTADASDAGLKRLAEQVADMAGAVPEDPHSRLARADELTTSLPALDLCDSAAEMSVKQLAALARETEEIALGMPRISNSDGAHAGQGMHWIGLSTSNGFSAGYGHSSTHLSLSLIAGIGDQMQTDHAGSQATYAADLDSAAAVATRAATRTASRLGARTGKTGQFPVLFDRRVAASLLRSLSRVISGPRLAKGTSFWGDHVGRQVCAPGITIIDDPLRLRGLRSSPFDAEGVPVARRVVVDQGVLRGLYLDLRSAGRLGLPPTGHATRGLSSPPSPSPSNLWIAAGGTSREDMIADIGEGFLVTELMGASISLATGDYSRGASGFWIEGGKIAYPVAEMTIAGNMKDMFLHMTPASDLEWRDGIDSPSLRVDGMMVATR